MRAGSDYAGFYSDVDFTRASIYFPAGSRLRLRASYAHDRSNLEFNPSLTNAPREERYRLGIDYRPVSATRMSFDYECQQRRDLLAPSGFDDEADRFAVSVVQSLRSLSFRSSAGLLRIRDRLGDAETDRLAYRVDAIWVPSDWQRYSAFFSHGHEGLTADPDLERSAGINARLSLGDRLQVDLQMEMRGLGGEDPETTQLVGDLAYVLRHGHTLSAEARYLRYDSSDAEDTTSILLSYAVPFGMPVGRRKDIGIVRGRVYLAEGPGQPGVADVILHIGGATAVTDSTGRFVFPSLKTGSYYLWVEAASLVPELVTVRKTPLSIEVAGGTESREELGLTRASSVHVRVSRFRPARGTGILMRPDAKKDVVEVGGYPNFLVGLVREDEVVRRTTGPDGTVLIRNLRPGRWKLSLPAQKLPKLSYVESPERELVLEPGGREELKVRIMPRFRRMVIIEDESED